MKKTKEEIPEKFWREYDELDMLGRGDKIKHIVVHFDKLFDMKDEKLRKHALATGLQGYFDDLIEYMYLRKDKDKLKR